MVEDFRFPRLGLGNQAVVQDFKDITTNLLELLLNLVSIFFDFGNMLV